MLFLLTCGGRLGLHQLGSCAEGCVLGMAFIPSEFKQNVYNIICLAHITSANLDFTVPVVVDSSERFSPDTLKAFVKRWDEQKALSLQHLFQGSLKPKPRGGK